MSINPFPLANCILLMIMNDYDHRMKLNFAISNLHTNTHTQSHVVFDFHYICTLVSIFFVAAKADICYFYKDT